MPSDDYYSILNLQRNATENDIKKAYHKMAMKWHPDKNQDDKERAERKFKEISEAYQVLSDKEKRAVYDRYGKEGVRGVPAAEPDFTGGSRARDHDYDRTWTDDRRQGSRHHGGRAFTRSYDGDDSRPSYYFMFRSPEEVFAEFFGGRDPFLDVGDIFSSSYVVDPFGQRGDSEARDYDRQRQRNSSHVNELSRRSRDGATTHVNIQDELRKAFGADDFAFSDSSSWNATFPERLNPASAKKFTSTTTSTKNGRKVVTRRVVENGVETVTVEENGVVKNRQVLRGPELL